MEFYQVFLKVILKEMKRFQLNTTVYSTFVNQLTASLDGNFDVSYSRCAYMYKYASNSIYFFKDSVNQFLMDCSDAKDMLSEWKSYPEVNVCSLSIGPGLDYLAFVLAILERDPLPPNFTGATVISKHGAWRNTVNFLLEVFHEQGSIFEVAQSKLKYDNMKVIQADLFKCFLEKRTIVPLSDAHVVLMMKTLNVLASGTPQEGPILNMLKGLISSLKSDAVIFCIDTKPSLALLTQVLSNFPGKFLYGPTYRSIKLPVDFPESEGCHPVMSARGAFFVWQKLPSFPSMLNLSTSLDVTIGTKSKVTVPCDSDISSISTSCSIKDEANEDKDFGDVPWIELKSIWQNSSPETKEILQKLMLSDIKSWEQANDTNFQTEDGDIENNVPLNVTRTELVKGAEGPSSVRELPLPTAYSLNSTIYDYSCQQNSSVDCRSFDTVNCLPPTENRNSVNSLIYKNITSLSEIEEMNPISDITKLNYDLPVNFKDDSGKTTIVKDIAVITSDADKVKTVDALDSNPIPSTSINILSEQINRLTNVSYDAPARYNSIKTKINCEEYIIAKDAAISSHEKVIQTDTHESSNSTYIKELTDRIKYLASSLESLTQQNELPNYKICDGSPVDCHSQHHSASNSDIHNNVASSCSKSNYESTEGSDLLLDNCTMEKKAFQCIGCNSRCHCCDNVCNIMPLHCCSRFCHFQPCHLNRVPMCNFLCNRMPCEGHFENPTSPSIVIPLQNISEEALLKVVSILESSSKSN